LVATGYLPAEFASIFYTYIYIYIYKLQNCINEVVRKPSHLEFLLIIRDQIETEIYRSADLTIFPFGVASGGTNNDFFRGNTGKLFEAYVL
jgi:hypothetical protein